MPGRVDRGGSRAGAMKILAYTSPARGHLYPVVPIMAALARRGHEASVVGLCSELGHLAPLGIEGSAIDPVVAERSSSRIGASACR